MIYNNYIEISIYIKVHCKFNIIAEYFIFP